MTPVLDFIIKDLSSVLLLIIADQILNESRFCAVSEIQWMFNVNS